MTGYATDSDFIWHRLSVCHIQQLYHEVFGHLGECSLTACSAGPSMFWQLHEAKTLSGKTCCQHQQNTASANRNAHVLEWILLGGRALLQLLCVLFLLVLHLLSKCIKYRKNYSYRLHARYILLHVLCLWVWIFSFHYFAHLAKYLRAFLYCHGRCLCFLGVYPCLCRCLHTRLDTPLFNHAPCPDSHTPKWSQPQSLWKGHSINSSSPQAPLIRFPVVCCYCSFLSFLNSTSSFYVWDCALNYLLVLIAAEFGLFFFISSSHVHFVTVHVLSTIYLSLSPWTLCFLFVLVISRLIFIYFFLLF